MCCFECHHLLYNPGHLEIMIAQMEALSLGLDMIVDELERLGSDVDQSLDPHSIQVLLRHKLRQRIDQEYAHVNSKNSKSCAIAKNIIQHQQNAFKEFMNGKRLKPTKKCLRCASHKQGLNVINNCLIIMSGIKGAAKKSQKNQESVSEIDLNIGVKGKSHLNPQIARNHLRALWNNEKDTLSRIFPFLNLDIHPDDESSPVDVFFWDTIIVSPNRFRPISYMNGRQFENERTSALSQIITASEVLAISFKQIKDNQSSQTPDNSSPGGSQSTASKSGGDRTKSLANFHMCWQKLQILCNRLYDSEMDKLPDNKATGVKQILEKKEGLFRKHMMGKRVNYASRSVISPDPYIMVDEIGVPLIFARKLSFPEPVNEHNIEKLRQMVTNGPDVHPGALSVTFENGQTIRLRPDDITLRKTFADRLVIPKSGFKDSNIRIVNRHLLTGDVLLLNRQPTLHKPSIMAHKARVLPKEKTLRLHYANCKCYNADFDGDEMNAHFPQSFLSRAEAYTIASVNFQYLVPKDGTPLSGLIQDHIISGVKLTIRGQFFTKGDYQELLYGALSFLNKPLKLVPPAIQKPEMLWSGKQIITTIIKNLVPEDKPLPTLMIASKISPKILQNQRPRHSLTSISPLQLTEMCESQVIIRKGELICGIIDKVNLGPNPYGLIHCCYELYGGSVSSALLSSFARLCTNYLQIHSGFTLGIHDILVEDRPNKKRQKYIKNSPNVGKLAAAEAMGVPDCNDSDLIFDKMRSAHTNKNDFLMKQLDKSMKGQTDQINNSITEVCLPKGLVKKFPDNNLQMMIQAGAKGGSVNAIQISCLLGQIELEGRRVPLMMSGRSLPSFKPYETEPRAGGFVAGRFMTGIRPQEFFFHCMAGREGLIDTAVKTSRSGYLQRCLIKHLEGLVVNYDLTVRDSEGSVIQMVYGEDGLDILKSQMLKEKVIPIVIQNNDALKPSEHELRILEKNNDLNFYRYQQKIKDWLSIEDHSEIKKRNSPFLNFSSDADQNKKSKDKIIDDWFSLSSETKKQFKETAERFPDPITSVYRPDIHLGSISENLDSVISKYMDENPHNLLNNSTEPLSISSAELEQSINSCFMKSLCNPGEAVGLLAAQSVGEPSTQMTLNTFHFAGRGEMNVTLGIPRLREILMTASPNIATPSMDIPFVTDFDGDIEAEAERMRLKLTSVKLSDVLEFVEVKETLEITESLRFRTYDITFQFLSTKLYKNKCYTNSSSILKFMENYFFKSLIEAITKKFKILSKSHGLFDNSRRISSRSKTKDQENEESNDGFETNTASHSKNFNEEEMSSDEENPIEDDGDTTAMRNKTRHNQDLEYEEPEDDEIQILPDSDAEEENNETNINSENLDQDLENMTKEERNLHRKMMKQARQTELESQRESRQNNVKNISPDIIDYDFDTLKERWCQLKVKYPLINTKLDMTSLIEEEAKRTYIHRVGRIERAFLVKDMDAAKRNAPFAKLLKTEGVSLLDVVIYDHIFDINRIYTNDIHAIANTYGIEAGAKALRREISNVFAVYGIHVDSRHLSLISDYMTFSGQIKGMNRQSMEGVSPIQAMTFETTTNFLKSATLIGITHCS